MITHPHFEPDTSHKKSIIFVTSLKIGSPFVLPILIALLLGLLFHGLHALFFFVSLFPKFCSVILNLNLWLYVTFSSLFFVGIGF